MPRKLADLVPGERVKGVVGRCEACDELFVGRVDARCCSEACRKATSRAAIGGSGRVVAFSQNSAGCEP